MRLEDLPDVHAARDAERVEDQVDRSTVLEERHVLDRDDLRDHALVAMAARHLVAFGRLPFLGYRDPHHLLHTRGEIAVFLTREHFHVHYFADLAVWHAQ